MARFPRSAERAATAGRGEGRRDRDRCGPRRAGTREDALRQPRGVKRAAAAGLTYVADFGDGISRRRAGNGFVYLSPRGTTIRATWLKERIAALAIPPAWEEVWICPRPNGHIQAVGRDADGRKQYIYHPDWRIESDSAKYRRLRRIARELPRIRRRVRRDLARRSLTRNRVLAAVVRLIDKVNVRVGSRSYTEAHGSRGATTLTAEHVEVRGAHLVLDFPGKSGQQVAVDLNDVNLARVVRQCEAIDGEYLFCYRTSDGTEEPVTAADVNDYLGGIASEPITAKDFRTWWACVLALRRLCDLDREDLTCRQRQRLLLEAIDETAAMLANTRAVCRNSYIHPGLVEGFVDGRIGELIAAGERSARRRKWPELTRDEVRLASVLPHLDG